MTEYKYMEHNLQKNPHVNIPDDALCIEIFHYTPFVRWLQKVK
jgi:hypothetical protein